MFGPQSFPLSLNEETLALEEEARRYQTAFLTRGMKAKGRQKAFKDMILERPKVPYFTRATESLAAALQDNPLQNHGETGVLVNEGMLAETNDVFLLRLSLPDGTESILYTYSDMSCIIGLRSADPEKIRVMTLPFKLRTARLSHQDRVRFLKLSIRMRNRATRGGVMASDHTKGPEIRIDAKNDLHAEFLRDLGIEIEAVVTQTEIDGPIYQITPQKIQESEKNDNGGLRMPTGPSKGRTLFEDQLGWLTREGVNAFDVHLPAITMHADQLIALKRLCEAAAKLAWIRTGLAGKRVAASLMVYAANPISGSRIDFRIQRSLQDRMAERRSEGMKKYFRENTEVFKELRGDAVHVEWVKPSPEELNKFLETFYGIFSEATGNMEIYGFQFLFLKGMVGSWVPAVVADIRLENLLDTAEGVDGLAAQVAFHRQRLEKMAA